MNDRKSIEEFPWDIDCDLLQYARELRKKGFTSTLPAWYLTEEDLHFLPDAVLVWFKGFGAVLPDSRNCSTTLDTVFASTHSLLPTSLYERSCASSITWFRKSLDSGTPCLKFLPNFTYCKRHVLSCQTVDKALAKLSNKVGSNIQHCWM